MASKYEIRVDKINEDGTRTPFNFAPDGADEVMHTAEVNGFSIIGQLEGGCHVVHHDVSIDEIAQAINANDILSQASKLALFMRTFLKQEASDAAQ